MKKVLLLLTFCFSFGFAFSQELSEKAEISLISCGYGEELYAQFGHTAIRFYDNSLNVDWVFNYGTFNYETEGFYLKFVKGITDYELGFDTGNDFFIRYKERNINVWEQKLNLTQVEKQRLFDAVLLNFQPENRFYRYNFVYDNCATRPRDMVEHALTDSLIYKNRKADKTFRQLAGIGMGADSWNKLGIDFVLGSSADKIATPREREFLPIELMVDLKDAKRPDGSNLVLSTTQVYEASPKEEVPLFMKPVFVCFVALFLLALISYLGRNKNMVWLDAILFTASGVMGIIIFYLTFFSLHPIVSANFNLLWLNPLQLLFVLFLPFKGLRKILFYYQVFNVIAILVALAGFIILPQEFNIAFLPLMLLLMMRGLFYIKSEKLGKNEI